MQMLRAVLMLRMVFVSTLLCLKMKGFTDASGAMPLAETAALFVLRGSLGIRSYYWPRGVDPCITWKGIHCHNGHLTDIELSGVRRTLKATALRPLFTLDSLLRFPFLRSFNASGFPLYGAIPYWFGKLASLQLLDLTSASINGSIPSSLGCLANLQVLILAHNNLTGDIPTSFAELRNLTSLDLSFNALTGHLPTFVNLVNLRKLNLCTNNLVGKIPLSLGSLANLEDLLLANNLMEGSIPNQLGDLYLLRRLDLSSNILSGPIPHEIGRLAFLNILVLSNNSLTGSLPIEIMNCKDIQVLSMDHNTLVGSLPSLLGSLKNISSLDLSFNNFTGNLPGGIVSLSSSRFIALSHNLFYGLLPVGLSDLPRMVKLDLSYNYFDGSVPRAHATEPILTGNCFSGIANQRVFEACKHFYNTKGLPFYRNTDHRHAKTQLACRLFAGDNKHPMAIIGGTFGGLGLVFIVMAFVMLVLKHEHKINIRNKQTVFTLYKGQRQLFSGSISVNLFSVGNHYSYSELQQATGDFGSLNLLKAGHSGDFYQGWLEGGMPILVKRIDLSKLKNDAYVTELELFGRASHTRLVPLLGHCLEHEDEKFLVYKYMRNRDLANVLHKKIVGSSLEDNLQSLDWITRLKIAIGAAEGLSYLHHECIPPLVHRDIQASSILLDDNFDVKLGSLTEIRVAEEEAHNGILAQIFCFSRESRSGDRDSGASDSSRAYDVFCFGKVLLELISGKVGISGSRDPVAEAWLGWVVALIDFHHKKSVAQFVDPSLLVDEDLLEEIWAMAIVAKSCLNPKPSERPVMRHIVKALENPLKIVRRNTLSRYMSSSSHSSWNSSFVGSLQKSLSENVTMPSSVKDDILCSSSKQRGKGDELSHENWV